MENSTEFDILDHDFILDDEFLALFSDQEFQCINANFSSNSSSSSSSNSPSAPRETLNKNGGNLRVIKKSNTYNKKALLLEKQRREKLNNWFLALAASLPHLRKADKVSIITEAFNYIKKLQLDIEQLKRHSSTRSSQGEDAVVVKKSELVISDHDHHTRCCSDPGNAPDADSSSLDKKRLIQEVEVKVEENSIILTIMCEKQTEILMRIFAVIAKLDLTIISAHVMSFADTTFNLVITAQVNKRNNMTKKTLVETLQDAIAIHEKLNSSIKQGAYGTKLSGCIRGE